MIYWSKLTKTIIFDYVTKSQLLTQIYRYRVFNKKATKIYGISINTFGKVWVADNYDNLTTFRILYDEGERLTRAKSEKFKYRELMTFVDHIVRRPIIKTEFIYECFHLPIKLKIRPWNEFHHLVCKYIWNKKVDAQRTVFFLMIHLIYSSRAG